MLLQTWGDVFWASLWNLWYGVVDYAPRIIVAVVIFVAGWVVGHYIGLGVSRIVSSLKLDKLLASLGLDDLMTRAGFRLNSGAFIGALFKWFVVAVFLLASVDML